MTKSKLFPHWFTIWFYLSCVILLIGGISDEISGKEPEGMNAWAASLAVFIMYLIILFIWNRKDEFRLIAAKMPYSLMVRFILIGWFFAGIDELINFPFNPLDADVTLLQDILFTSPPYIMAHMMWFRVLRTYRFSYREAIFTGGLSLGIVGIFQ